MPYLLFFLVTFAAVVAVGTKRKLAQRAKGPMGMNAMLELRQGVLSRTFFADSPPLAADTPRCVLMDWNMSGPVVATLLANAVERGHSRVGSAGRHAPAHGIGCERAGGDRRNAPAEQLEMNARAHVRTTNRPAGRTGCRSDLFARAVELSIR